MRTLARTLTQPLTSARTYQRWAHLIIGGALLVPYAIAALVLALLLLRGGQPDIQQTTPAAYLTALLITLTLVTATAYLPGVQTAQLHLARNLLGGPLAHTGTPSTTTWRTALWLNLHLFTGLAVSMLTMITLTEAAMLASTPLRAHPTATLLTPNQHLIGTDPTTAQRLSAPLLALAYLLALIYLTALTASLLSRAAHHLLGPSPADRLAAAHAHAHTLAERNRLARELHDSIGHALSVVALQSATAARLLDTNPDFARQALTHIAETARTATTDLDHALGVLRDQTPTTRTPPPDLTHLPHLATATHHTETELTCHINGDPATVPALHSRESYRITQEALTNALHHAPGQPLTLTLDITATDLTLTLTNPRTPTRRPHRRTSQRGITGMRERAHLLGGTLTTEPTPTHWHLTLHLTWKEQP